MKRKIGIVALVIVMGTLMCLLWGYGMVGSHFGDVLLSLFGTSAAPTDTVTDATVPPETTGSPTLPPETTVPPTSQEATRPADTTQGTTPDTRPTPDWAELTARQFIVVNTASGETLCRLSNGSGKVYPASITKLFTAYVALQYLDPSLTVTAGDELQFVGSGSSMAYIRRGQSATVEKLIQGLVLPSGNDAAYILAAAAGRVIAGDNGLSAADAVRAFVDRMNVCARELGMTGTHFANPDGYHQGSHFTSLEDAVILARAALDTPLIAQTVQKYSVRAELSDGTVRYWRNTNELVNPNSEYYREGVCGLKTGHTKEAGYCLLSAVRQEEGYLIIGVFGCPGEYDRFADTLKLIDIFAETASN